MGIRRTYFDGFHLFILQIGLYWIAIVGGAAISVLTFVLDGFGLPRLPRGAVYAVCFASVIVAFFKAWQAEHREAERLEADLRGITNSKPQPSVTVQADKSGVRLMIRNDGAQGAFTARLTMEADSKRREGCCRWRGPNSESLVIASGGEGCIELAEFIQGGGSSSRDNLPAETAWRVHYWSGQKQETMLFGRRKISEGGDDWKSVEVARLRVELISDPQMLQGREVLDFRLVGATFVDASSGEAHRVEARHVSEVVRMPFVVW